LYPCVRAEGTIRYSVLFKFFDYCRNLLLCKLRNTYKFGSGCSNSQVTMRVECKVYVGNLGNNACKHELEDVFSKYGPLVNVWVARNPPGFAFVEFEDPRDARDATKCLDGVRICGSRARVEMSTGRTATRSPVRRTSPRRRTRSRSPRRRSRSRSRSSHRSRTARRSRSRKRSVSPKGSRSRRSRSRSPRYGRRSSPVYNDYKRPASRSVSRSKSPVSRSRSRS